MTTALAVAAFLLWYIGGMLCTAWVWTKRYDFTLGDALALSLVGIFGPLTGLAVWVFMLDNPELKKPKKPIALWPRRGEIRGEG